MDMTAARQPSDIIWQALSHIFHYTRPLMMITRLLLRQSKFWLDCTQCITVYFVIGNILLQITIKIAE